VSDAAVHPSGYGTCAWIIRGREDLWSGEGYVPAPTSKLYSGLAEAYGIYTLLRFFGQYTRLYPLTILTPHTIHVYCDNSGVITRINSHLDTPYPQETIRDDYPIFAEIHHQIQELHPYCFEFHHVKGHQDKHNNQPLSVQERLNIDCDKRAPSMLPPPLDMALSQHPKFPASYPHLCIHETVVTQHVTHVLRDAATGSDNIL